MSKKPRPRPKSASRSGLLRWLALLGAAALFVFLLSRMDWWETALRFLFPGARQVLHPRASLLVMTGEHLRMVLISGGLTVLVGVPVGVWVTRASGLSFLPLVSDLTSLGQTFPPVAVLALAVPILGFGVAPTVFALFLYGLLPVVRNTIAGLRGVGWNTLEVAYGMGMGHLGTLMRVEMPLAAPVILAGIRISLVINIGTAMLGATIGAGGLGSPIVAGLVQNNLALILEGAIPAAGLAVLADQLLANIEKGFAYRERV